MRPRQADVACVKCGYIPEIFRHGFYEDPGGHATSIESGLSPCCGADLADLDEFCPECERHLPDDERVQAGMKCGQCAYGYYSDPDRGKPNE